MSSTLFSAAGFLTALLIGLPLAGGQDMPTAPIEPFLKQHCLECHSGEVPAGGLNLKSVSRDLTDAEVRRRWVYLYDRVAGGEMPPASADRPEETAKSRFQRLLGELLTRADQASRKVVMRRLNRSEYQNTVRDLFDIHVDLTRLLPEDRVQQGFDTRGSSLSLSAEHMVLYIDAADLVLDQVFGPAKPPQRVHKRLNFKDLRAVRSSHRLSARGGVHFNASRFPLWETSVPTPGTYRLRLEVQAVQTDEPLILQVNGGLTMQIAAHVAGFVEIPPGEIRTIELTDRALETGDNFGVSLIGGYPWSKVDAAQYKGPGVFIGDIEIEGPLEPWPPASRVKLLVGVDLDRGTLEDIREILQRKLPYAFRRATNPSEVQPYVKLAQQALDEGLLPEQALRRGLKGILSAPEFLFLEESLDESKAHVDDFALASRLSYFLWRSLPDQKLLSLAGRGRLRQPAVLRAQVDRLLADPKSERFVESFTAQWLRLADIDFTVPDRNLYPEYNPLLRQSMLEETRAFFRELLDGDHSVQNFIDSDFVMINRPLAEFYGIDGVKGLDIRRVDLAEDSLRGGVLTQASVLKVSADGTRTSPVLRGAWILKNLYGTPSPPPPPTVDAVEPDIRGAATIREQLARHRNHARCNRCHRKIDPPGFALESFDVIGAQREWYRTRGRGGKWVNRLRHPHNPRGYVQYRQGPDVDSSGTMPDGRAFADIREYKRLLLNQQTAMAQSLTRLLLTYALGREMGFSDRPEISRIVQNVRSKNYGLRSIIHEVVQSPTFRSP